MCKPLPAFFFPSMGDSALWSLTFLSSKKIRIIFHLPGNQWMFSLLQALLQCSAELLPQFPHLYKNILLPHRIHWTSLTYIQKILGGSLLEML